MNSETENGPKNVIMTNRAFIKLKRKLDAYDEEKDAYFAGSQHSLGNIGDFICCVGNKI